MAEAFRDIRRATTPNAVAMADSDGAEVSAALTAWPDGSWEQLLTEQADAAPARKARSVRLKDREPGVPAEPTILFAVAADADLEAAVKEVDSLISKVNTRYREEVMPRRAAAMAAKRERDEQLAARQAALTARAARLAPLT